MSPITPVAAIARRVKNIRASRGLTASQLGELLTEQGVSWDRFTVAGLESGKRQNVSVAELLALSAVLNVAPVHLLLPIDDDDAQYQVTPHRAESVDTVRGWVRGHYPLPGSGVVKFQNEMPEGERGFIHVRPAKGSGGRLTIEGVEEVLAQATEALRNLREEDERRGEHR